VTAFNSKPGPAVDRGRHTPSPEIVAVPRTNPSPRGTAPQAELSRDLATITPAATRGAPPAAQAGAGITAVSRLPSLSPSTTTIPRAAERTDTNEPDTLYRLCVTPDAEPEIVAGRWSEASPESPSVFAGPMGTTTESAVSRSPPQFAVAGGWPGGGFGVIPPSTTTWHQNRVPSKSMGS